MMTDKQLQWIKDFIKKHHLTNRVTVSPATNQVAEDLQEEFGGRLHEVSSGEEVLTWIIPEQWEVNEAWIETLNGERILDFDDHPLHLKSYSDSFEGEVSRKKLVQKVDTLPDKPQQIPYHYGWEFDYQAEEDWGFCAPHEWLEGLEDEKYRVKVDTEFSEGTMKIFDWELQGESEQTIFFAAHSCHPGQVNDGLAAVALLAKLFSWLSGQENRKYTYRLFVGPEYFTAAALMEKLTQRNNLAGGVYLDLPGVEGPLGFSKSFEGDTYIDQAIGEVFKENFNNYECKNYREIIGNDEMIYDGPDFEIPTVPVAHSPEYSSFYHTNEDNLNNTDFQALEEVFSILEDFILLIEKDFIPERNYTGNLYFSRYNLTESLNQLHKKEQVDSQFLHYIQRFIDGKNGCLDLAEQLNISFESIYSFIEILKNKDLVRKAEEKIFY